MKRISIFALASTCMLVIAGVFASKAAKKFTLITKAMYFNGSTFVTGFGAANKDILTITSTNNNQAFFTITVGGTPTTYDLYTSGSSHHPLYIPG